MANTKKTQTRTKQQPNTRKPVQKKQEEKARLPKEVLIIIGLIVAVLLELCNFDVLGTVGGWLKYVQFGLFGTMAYLFPVFILILFLYMALAKVRRRSQVIFGIIFFICLCMFSNLLAADRMEGGVLTAFTVGAEEQAGGGIIGGLPAAGLMAAVGKTGSFIITIMLIIFSAFMVFRRTVTELVTGRRARAEYEPDPELEQVRSSAKSRTSQTSQSRETASSRVTVPRRNSRGVKVEEKTYESEEGTIIKIVQANPSKKKKHVATTRTRKKAAPMRDGTVQTTRTRNKTKGISDSVNIVSTNAGGDEVHEITKAKVIMPEVGPASAPVKKEEERPKTSVITVTDVVREPAKPAPVQEPVPVSAPVAENAGEITTPKKIKVKNVTPEVKPQRESLSGKTFSHGEPERTFKPVTYQGDKPKYSLPPMELLSRSRAQSSSGDDMEAMAQKLEMVMANFGVHAKVVNTQIGPSVTRFELQPEMGTRVNKITSLADDLKLNLAVPDIRIEAPIPGRAAVGIEIPNKTRQTVTMRELLEAPELINHPSKIAFAAGKDISGNVIVADIASMPHLLVAGTTGSGKSTFLNTMIMCILYRARPDEVGFIIIDPKRIEFGVYAGIPHLMKNVVTDPAQAVSTLRWAVAEMTDRYQRMQYSGVKDFKSYNEKFERGQISEEEPNPRKMHQIVIVIDELADLMMVAAKEAESLICRLAQLARAAGIHLVIATQRPSVDVVTGLIKANIPARVALLVASGVDSRTIIDMVGAEKLLGHGDMLFYPTGYVKPVRVQGAYVSEKEIHDTVKFLAKSSEGQKFFEQESEKMEQYQNGEVRDAGIPGEAASADAGGASKYDELLREAGLACIEMGKASSSMLQRRFSIGFNRAARIIDQLYEIGAIGPQNGAKPREIMVDSMTFEEMYQSLE